MIYTADFGKEMFIPGYMRRIAISLWKPRRWRYYHMPTLAPTRQLLVDRRNDVITTEQYSALFALQLESLDVKRYGEKLQDSVLFCYEPCPQYCHRHIVADWLTQSGYCCIEYVINDSDDIDDREFTAWNDRVQRWLQFDKS